MISTNYYEFIVFRMITGNSNWINYFYINRYLIKSFYNVKNKYIIKGLSVGGEYTAIFAAVDEFIPPKNRVFLLQF